MINYQFFPHSRGDTPEMTAIIECFKKAEKKGEDKQVSSNEILTLVRSFPLQ